VSPDFFPCKLLLKVRGIVSAYHETYLSVKGRWTYFTYSGIVILEEEMANKFTVKSTIAVEEMSSVEGSKHKENYKIVIETKENVCYKWLVDG
jgi:hypothetical protein